MTRQNPKLEILTDELEIRRLIAAATDSQVAVDVSIPGLGIRFEEKITALSNAKVGVEVKLIPGLFNQIKERSPEGEPPKQMEAFFILFLEGQMLLGIQGTHLLWTEKTVRIAPPFKVLKIQRRKETRWVVPKGYDLKVELPIDRGMSHHRRLLDLSFSGLAFHVPTDREASLYRKGTIIRGVRLTLDHRSMLLNLEVANQIALRTPKQNDGYKIGTKFTALNPTDQNWLNGYITHRLAQLGLG